MPALWLTRICFMEMIAEQLSFEDQSFDVVISRNLTWNLPNPERHTQSGPVS